MSDGGLRQQAEEQLARREATGFRVTNRESYLNAIVRRLEREQANLPGTKTAGAQEAIRRRNEERREPLPPRATPEQIAASKVWLARMRASLGRPQRAS